MKNRIQLLICGGTGCTSALSKEIRDRFVRELEEKEIHDCQIPKKSLKVIS